MSLIAGARRSISAVTSLITAVLPLSKLAQTRLFLDVGEEGPGCRAGCGEKAGDDLLWGPHPRRAGEDGCHRSHSFLIGFLPFGQPCPGVGARQGLTMGMPLQSTAATRIRAGGAATERC